MRGLGSTVAAGFRNAGHTARGPFAFCSTRPATRGRYCGKSCMDAAIAESGHEVALLLQRCQWTEDDKRLLTAERAAFRTLSRGDVKAAYRAAEAEVERLEAEAREARRRDDYHSMRVAMGGNDAQTLKAFREAEAYEGPSLIIAYSHCIAHGYDLRHGMDQQKAAVLSGHWPLFRYDPGLRREGKNPMQLDSKAPTVALKQYAYNETRYTMLAHSDPEAARRLLDAAQDDVWARWRLYEYWAAMPGPGAAKEGADA